MTEDENAVLRARIADLENTVIHLTNRTTILDRQLDDERQRHHRAVEDMKVGAEFALDVVLRHLRSAWED